MTSRGNERKKIYFSKYDYNKFKEYLGEAQDKYGYKLHCYVLMSNHYHLVIETPNGNISKIMHYINGAYTNYINKKRNRSGHLLQGRYKGILIDQDRYLLELSRYLHLNPVRAGMVSKPEEYPYSSYNSYIARKKETIITRELILRMISRDSKDGLKQYKEFVENALEDEIENPIKDLYGGVILGGTQFIKNALGQLGEKVKRCDGIIGRREFQLDVTAEEIVSGVMDYFHLDSPNKLKSEKRFRDICIYQMKKHTGMTNKQIGEFLGGISQTAVSKANQRFDSKLKNDRSLRRILSRLEKDMSHVES